MLVSTLHLFMVYLDYDSERVLDVWTHDWTSLIIRPLTSHGWGMGGGSNHDQCCKLVLSRLDRPTNSFEGKCRIHAGCTMTRTCNEPKGNRIVSKPGQGRAMAEILSWLEAADEPGWGTPEKGLHKEWRPRKDRRLLARARLKTSQAGLDMLSHERPPRPGESSEPDSPIS